MQLDERGNKEGKGQKEAIDWLMKLGQSCRYDWEVGEDGNPLPNRQPRGPVWLRTLLGVDYFAAVVRVDLVGSQVTNHELKHLNYLPQVQKLYLIHTDITDAGMEHLAGLTQLQTLHFVTANVSDAGLEHLKGLTQLQSLCLMETQITGSGFKHFKGMTKLRELTLTTHRSRMLGWNISNA